VKKPGAATIAAMINMTGCRTGQVRGTVPMVNAVGAYRDSPTVTARANSPHSAARIDRAVHGSGRYLLTPSRRPEERSPIVTPIKETRAARMPMR